jgi:hypothetical protein
MNEAQRMALCGHYDLLWPIWSNEKVVGLLRAAMSQFNTSFASFSIFNEKNEVFKAEKGYDQPELDRKISIAAHVLYTNEVLVLLDTQKVCLLHRLGLISNFLARTGDFKEIPLSLVAPVFDSSQVHHFYLQRVSSWVSLQCGQRSRVSYSVLMSAVNLPSSVLS